MGLKVVVPLAVVLRLGQFARQLLVGRVVGVCLRLMRRVVEQQSRAPRRLRQLAAMHRLERRHLLPHVDVVRRLDEVHPPDAEQGRAVAEPFVALPLNFNVDGEVTLFDFRRHGRAGLQARAGSGCGLRLRSFA